MQTKKLDRVLKKLTPKFIISVCGYPFILDALFVANIYLSVVSYFWRSPEMPDYNLLKTRFTTNCSQPLESRITVRLINSTIESYSLKITIDSLSNKRPPKNHKSPSEKIDCWQFISLIYFMVFKAYYPNE